MTTTVLEPQTPEVPDQPEVEPSPEHGQEQVTAAPIGLTCASSLLATMAFGWVAGSVFDGILARLVGLAAAVFGVGVVYLSTRARRPSLVQYAGAGAAVVAGALIAVTFTGQGADLASVVVESLRGGGLAQPPLAFDPGWRFLLFVTVALLAEASGGLALSLNRPRAAALVALPFVVGGSLLQSSETEITATLVALLLLVGSLALSFGADLAAQGSGSASFEARRLARGAAALVALGALLFGTAQIGFLFPPPAAEQVVPPMRPPPPPPAVDRVLFSVTADRATPWRLGTLDVYDGAAWLTPPFDVSALVAVDGEIPQDLEGDTVGALPGPTITARIELADLPGKTLPGLANPLAVHGGPQIEYDPRTQMLRTAGVRPPQGTTYEVIAAAPPSGEVLSQAGPPGPAVAPFLEVPPAPPEVAAILAEAPVEPFARLQHVRTAYFAEVVAAGSGDPVDVPPRRVVEMLAGQEATPYEITAGEVLLARWAGIPARVGYGWFGGAETEPGTWEIRPKHGATWLEAHFEGAGWVPIVGTPPRAKPSTAAGQRNDDPSVRPTDELALLVYVPVELSTVRLAYVLARHYVLVALPYIVLLALLAAFYPGLVKTARRTARRRAAGRLGPRARIAAAYAELRDDVTDLGIASPALSPLALVGRVEPDAEHGELAWLVTRSLWGDLRRDVRPDDVEAAEVMSRSVSRRLRSAQPALSRLAALASRASLANPWTDELPTMWPRSGSRTARRALIGGTAVVLAAALVVSLPSEPEPRVPAALPERVVPESIGDIRFVREEDAESAFQEGAERPLATEGLVYSVREGDVVQGSLQVARLDPRFDTRSPRVRDQILSGLGNGRLRPDRVGEERIFRLDQAEQTLLLSFAPNGQVYYLMAARRDFAEAEQVFTSALAFTRGERAAELRPPDVPVPDPRRGSDR